MNEQKKEAAAQWWAECNKRIYDFPEKPARSIFEQGFVAGQAAQQSGPSTEVKRSRLYKIDEELTSALRQFRHNTDNSRSFFSPEMGFVVAYDKARIDHLIGGLKVRIAELEGGQGEPPNRRPDYEP